MRWDDEIKLFATSADSCKKLIVQNPDPHSDGFYGGINEHGVAIVATYVHVAENQISYLRKPYIRLILEAKTARRAVNIIRRFSPRIGGNFFVADPRQCFGIEAVPEQYFVEKIIESGIKTNHFIHLPNHNLGFDREPGFQKWSEQHHSRAQELVGTAKSVEDMQNLLMDRKYATENRAICTTDKEESCFTHSAFVFDTRAKAAYYSQGSPLTTPFKRFDFS